MAAKIPNDIFQFGTTGGLQAGYSDHGPIVHHLQGYGTLGIGVFAGSDKELLFVDSKAYQIGADGGNSVQKAPPDAGLAFVMVTKFIPEYQLNVNGSLEKNALLDVFSSRGGDAGGKNSFIPFRIRGEFAKIRLNGNSDLRNHAALQSSESTGSTRGDEISNVRGTVVGFIGPESFAGVSVTGVHGFFLADGPENGDRVGGSLIDFEAKGDVEVSWAVTGRFHIGFPRGDEWESLDIKKPVGKN